jgi:putative cardiolipin synthase
MMQMSLRSIAKNLRDSGALHIFLFCLGAGLIVGRRVFPSLQNRSVSKALSDTATTRLGTVISSRVAAHPGKSGIYPLSDGRDAFAARMLLARVAERSLDVQYYIWHKDMTGTLLFDSLRAAADRGVRVRLLLDDNNTSGLDTTLAALDTHPNIEVRLFNPFLLRQTRALGYFTDFFRANRRMHNKSFTVDNQATIVGGRNVGDEYFGAPDKDALFVDLDVMAVGPVVDAVSTDFDRYWACASSYPADRMLSPVDPGKIADIGLAAAVTEHDPVAVAYVNAVRHSSFVHQLLQGALELEWADTRMVSDDPAKGIGRAAPEALLAEKLKGIIGNAAVDVALVSPYFVPTAAGVAAFIDLAKQNVSIRVLTNSLEATDVAAVHAGYAKRRVPLLKGGIALYELRRLSSNPFANRIRGQTGSSASSLHAKTFSVDGSRVFIGSFNFDPRSAKLNTEMGFVIDSPPLAQKIAAAFNEKIRQNAYEVELSGRGQLIWIESRGGKEVRHGTEPGSHFWQRAAVWFMSVLPIDWLL